MSKSASSAAGIIEMLDDPKVSAKKIRSAVTDSEAEVRFDEENKPGVSNLLTIYSALTGRADQPTSRRSTPGSGYGDLKGDLAEVVVEFVTPFRDRTLELLDDRAELDAILRPGPSARARSRRRTLADVYDRVGLRAARPRRRRSPLGSAPCRPSASPSRSPSRGAASSSSTGIDLGDESARHIPTHITLLPPHEVDPTRTSTPWSTTSGRWRRRAEPFDVHLRGTGTFRPVSPVVFVGVVEGISQCEQLAADVQPRAAGGRPGLPLPPARDGGPPPARGRPRPGLRRARRFDVPFDVTRCGCTSTHDELRLASEPAFPLAGAWPRASTDWREQSRQGVGRRVKRCVDSRAA